jgi:mannonate dehydratase
MRSGSYMGVPPRAEYLQYARQFGITDLVMVNSDSLPAYDGKWQVKDLAMMRLDVESHGLKLAAMENVPIRFYDHIMLNGPRRDEQIDNMITTVRNMALAGIPVFGYHWMPSLVWRTTPKMIRGGAMATAFNYEEARDLPLTHDREYTEEEMWENLEYWVKIITPIAEEVGIRLGIHPCDPPVEQIGGIPQLFNSYDNYRRYLDIYDSPYNAIEFCQGTISEMADSGGDNIYGFIDEMVRRDKVLYVHFRNVSAPNPNDFHEEFINTGHVDMHRAMKTYYAAGYDSFFIDDHVPRTHGDTPWGHQARSFAFGYIQAMIEAVTKETAHSN